MKKQIFVFLFLFTSFQTTVRANQDDFVLDNSTRNYDQQHIKLELSFDFEKETVFGKATIKVRSLVDDFKEIVFHSKITQISSVRLAGKKLKYNSKNGLLFIRLNRHYPKNEIMEIVIQYVSEPTRGLFFFFPTESEPEMPYQIWSQGQGEDNRYWFPAYDLPGDKLRADIIATVPEQFSVISNGTLMSVRENSEKKEKTFHWKMDYEQVTYLISIIIGEFFTVSDTIRGIPLNYNISPKFKNANPDIIFGRTPAMIAFYSDYIGAYPYEKYDQTPVHDFKYGGMENASATTLNERIFHDERARPNYSPNMLIAHELAHQWFGDLLTVETWPHFWLHEGFATYLTDLFTEYENGTDEFRIQRLLQNRVYFERREQIPITEIEPTKEPATPIDFYGILAYNRGAAILHTLRYELGDAVFKSGLQHYIRRFRFGNVVTEDFRNAMEEISGRDLSRFFQQWAYGAGHPEFDVSWQWNDSTQQVSLHVKQTQPEAPTMGIFEMKIPIEITAGPKRLTRQILITQREHTFTYPLPQKPDIVRFDKGYWNLKELNFEKSLDELTYQVLFDDDITGRYRAAEQLTEYSEKAIPVLEKALYREPHYAVRQIIIKSLGLIGGPAALEVLRNATTDTDARVREEVMKALANFDAAAVANILKNHYQIEKNDYVRGAALSSLGQVKPTDAFQILTDALKHDSHKNIIRCSVFAGFKSLQDPHAIPLAKEFVKYKYSSGGMHLLEKSILGFASSIQETHREDAIAIALEALKNPFFRIRYQAGSLLKKLDAKESVPALKQQYRAAQRRAVKDYLKALIEYFENK